jgi:hypothetical protein
MATKKVIVSKYSDMKPLEKLNGHLAANYDTGVFTYELPYSLPIQSSGLVDLRPNKETIREAIANDEGARLVFPITSDVMNKLKLLNMTEADIKTVIERLEMVVADLKRLDEQINQSEKK